MYPKNEGILIPFSSAMALTMKLGAFPMYVFAPMNTAPVEIAARRRAAWGSSASAPMYGPWAGTPSSPAAVAAKARYVGALSSTLDSAPDVQKTCQGWDT